MRCKGEILSLKGKTLNGKNRVLENGREWVGHEVAQNVGCLGGKPEVLIAPLDETQECGVNKDKMRWLANNDDVDFEEAPVAER